MKNRNSLLIGLVLVTILVLSACSSGVEFDIRGNWRYEMIAANGMIYDRGTINFAGQPDSGNYFLLNVKEVAYEGEYEVAGIEVTLTGDETWMGTFVDSSHLNGTWSHPDKDANGFWIAERMDP